MPQYKASVEPLAMREVQLLLKDLHKRPGINSMVWLVLNSGMSLKDALSIDLHDLDFASNIVKVYDYELKRKRLVMLPERTMGHISIYLDSYEKPTKRLFEISDRGAMDTLNALSTERIGKPITWIAIRRTWAVLAFARSIAIGTMLETSGAPLDSLAKWAFWEKFKNTTSTEKFMPDLLEGIV